MLLTYNSKTLPLHVPSSWTVGRMKELVLLYHPETPSIRSQVLIYEERVLPNSALISSIFHHESKPEVLLQIETVPEPPPHLVGYKSKLFKAREEEYIKKYDIAKQLLLDTHHKAQDSSVIPQFSVLGTLPLVHPDTVKRVKFMTHVETQKKIRLRRVPWTIFFDVVTIFRWFMFTVIARMCLGTSISVSYYMIIFLCYVVNIRFKIENHREKELKKLPREYLMVVLPERYTARREELPRYGSVRVGYESFRGFWASLLPWFDPVQYANLRNHIIN